MKKHTILVIGALVLATISGLVLTACSDDDADGATGTLQFQANGEDFVRQGFVSKDGWRIAFDNVYVTLSEITAYQTDPPYDAHTGGQIDGEVEVSLDGIHTIDLAEGGENADPILVGEMSDVRTGHYNAISWEMARADSGPAAAYSVMMVGTAEKDGQTEDFSITIDSVCDYHCGEFVGDERKGFVSKDGTAEMEMTFHFDHLFGDAELSADDPLNTGAPGYEALRDMPQGGGADFNMAELHLGHVGEGHCHCECE